MITKLYDVCAPAKLNLFLHVVGRREDGYHLLQSAFMLIDWCDTLNFEVRNDGKISREDLSLALPDDDLIVRAARLLQTAGQTNLGAHISVEKVIPSQAGMGGGSSDAATTLLALNRLWNLQLPLAQLTRLGLTLGADVPFFLQGQNAWVEGIGEQITPIELPEAQFLVVKPSAGVETAAIFSAPNLKRNTPTAIIEGFADDPFGFGGNDLQSVAELHCPEISQALDFLNSMGLDSRSDSEPDDASNKRSCGRMTGSGSAVFAKVQAHEIAKLSQQLSNIGILNNAPSTFEMRICKNLASHPLRGWAS